jgi:LacI family transcriptional regulator
MNTISSITGVGNTDLGATQTPALTSIRTPIVETGRAAAEQLIARLEGRPYVPFETLPFELVIRGSTGPPPGRAPKGRHAASDPTIQRARDGLE